MRALVSWSSGKDSAWMLHVLKQDTSIEIGALLTTMNEAFDRVAMHAVRRTLVEAQARAAGIPLWTVPLPWPCSNEDYESRMRVAVARAVAEGFTHVAFGDLFLEDVRRYREDRLAGTGLTPIFPIWGIPTDRLAGEMIAGGLRAVLTCVNPKTIDRSFAGRQFDRTLLADLPSGIDPCGERGEFHSFAYDGPMFAHQVSVMPGEVVDRDGFVFADILPA
ncbi:MAG: adenine nucleotide alpha hydrolase [Vicinamibacterales bacterium]|nr:adenine nucleotide alpha hydrolase [Vicinamibacterales bacterium]